MSRSSTENRLRHWRKQRGFTQLALAREIGVTRQSIIAIEKGRLNPSVTIALHLAQALRVRVEDLFSLAPASAVPVAGDTETPGAVFHLGLEPAEHALSDTADVPSEEDEPEEPSGAWDFV